MTAALASPKTGAFIIAGDSLVVVIGGVNYTISKTSCLYQQVKNCVVRGNWELAASYLEQAVNLKGEIWWNTEEFMVYYGLEPLHHSLADRLPRMFAEGFDTTPMLNFLKNLFANPAVHAINELYEFLEKNGLPITEDGCFLAYKKVREDYLDCYSQSISNKVGEKPSMDRDTCDPIRTNHCSTGYHFCGLSYLTCFNGERVMVVKINPKDVTSIPNDYNFAKGRCCTYEVIDEYGGTDVQRYEAFSTSVAPGEFEEEEFQEGEDEFYCSECGAEHSECCTCEQDQDEAAGQEEVEEPNLFSAPKETDLSPIHNPITKARVLRGLTQEQVASALDMPLRIYAERVEVEGRPFKPSTVGRILQVIETLAGEE
jgi:hypothetical protein